MVDDFILVLTAYMTAGTILCKAYGEVSSPGARTASFMRAWSSARMVVKRNGRVRMVRSLVGLAIVLDECGVSGMVQLVFGISSWYHF